MFWDLFEDSAENGWVLAFKFRIAIEKSSSSSSKLFICKFTNKQNRNPLHLQIAESAFICGFRLQILQILLTFADRLRAAESKTAKYIRLLWNPRHNTSADKIYVTGICARNPRKFCKWNPFTFCNMFKDLSMESKNIQMQN